MLYLQKQAKKIIKNRCLKDKKHCKIGNYCHYTRKNSGALHSIFILEYSVPKNVPIVFHNRSNYDYHFVIKDLAEEFKKQLLA